MNKYDYFLHSFLSGQTNRITVNGNVAAARSNTGQIAIYANIFGHKHSGLLDRLTKALTANSIDFYISMHGINNPSTCDLCKVDHYDAENNIAIQPNCASCTREVI